MSESYEIDEVVRLKTLRSYDILDTPADEHFDKITRLVKSLLRAPIATINMIDADRQWSKSFIGLQEASAPRSISFCTHTIKSDRPMIIPDARIDPIFKNNPMVVGEPHIVSYAGVPLRTLCGHNIGTLCVSDVVPRDFSAEDINTLTILASIIIDELDLRRLSSRDLLTGALSRRGFSEHIRRSIDIFNRYQIPQSLVMFDLDHFKKINDSLGHPAGDAVLKGVSSRISDNLRSNDHLGRLGGEEFAILMTNTSLADAVMAADRLRAMLADNPIYHGEYIKVTASFGVADIRTDEANEASWIARADKALYRAKAAGRNICHI